jgi:hypothetical protein
MFRSHRSSLRTILIVVLATCSMLAAAVAQDPSVNGQWSGVMTWPTANAGWVPTHAILMSDGRVLYDGSYGDGLTPHIFDPATNSVTTAGKPTYNLFCMGHTHLADGRIFTAGGHIDDYQGYAHASIYSTSANTWTNVPDMNAGRWYPTNTTLANGDVLVVSGDIHGPASSQVYNEVPQVYQVATNSWRTLSSATLHLQLYPFMFLAPNGKVFLAGWNPDTKYLNTSGTGSWSAVASSIHGWRNYGAAVMYDAGKIILIGGDGDSSTRTVTATAETIDLNATTPTWKSVASMHHARRQHNATLLPDGTILVTGGSSASGFDVASGAVYAAELWNPANNTWTVLASAAKYRGYHSFALLLPDGRVLSAGGQINAAGGANGANAEIFSPPYLFKGARPAITSAPANVSYGQTALIGTSDTIARATWIRLSAVTHSFNQEQRFLNLNFTATSGGVNVTFPSSANLSPPGDYMLFLLNSAGVPSVGKIIQIGGSSAPPATGTITGAVTKSADGTAISGATVSYSGGSATTDSVGHYTLANAPTGTYNVTAAASGFASKSQSVTVTQNATTTSNFALAASSGTGTGTVTGKITNISTGGAISGASVSWSGGSTTSNTSGIYTLSNVTAGTIAVTAFKTGYLSRTVNVTVNSGATTTANIAIATSGKLAGKVTTSTGAVVSGATVKITGGKVATTVNTTTNSTGNYATTWISVGTYTITVSKTGHTTQSKSATVNVGATTTVNFTSF